MNIGSLYPIIPPYKITAIPKAGKVSPLIALLGHIESGDPNPFSPFVPILYVNNVRVSVGDAISPN
jgi:hypothetical protein